MREEGQSRRERERGGSGKGQEASKKPGAIVDNCTASLRGSLSRSGKHGNIDQITRRAGYGGVLTLTREHRRVYDGSQNTRGASRK